MKRLELIFPSGSYLLVELPEAAQGVVSAVKDLINNDLHSEYITRVYSDDKYLWRLPYHATLVGKLSSLEEEDYAGIVDYTIGVDPISKDTENLIRLYKSYTNDGWYRYPSGAFESAVEAAGWYLENPLFEPDISGYDPEYKYEMDCFKADRDEWQSYQEKTFNPEHTYIFKRI